MHQILNILNLFEYLAGKALCCYGGDVSRLLDVARGRIAVAGAADATCILAALGADWAVRIVRVRNYTGAAAADAADRDMSGGFHVRRREKGRLGERATAREWRDERGRMRRESERESIVQKI